MAASVGEISAVGLTYAKGKRMPAEATLLPVLYSPYPLSVDKAKETAKVFATARDTSTATSDVHP